MKTTYYTQGIYKVINQYKYKGSLPVIYRSRAELLLMRWFDIKNNIIEWTSESVVIPYIKPTDGRMHRYFIDFSCKFKNPDNTTTKYIIEYKPFKQTQQPLKTTKKSERSFLIEQMTFAINRAKWQSAEDYARHQGMKFIIVTERELNQFSA